MLLIADASIKIWNMSALADAAASKEALLATLSTHSKPVNIVRWSRDGRVLASGSDDNYVLIHKYSPGGYAHTTFGSNSTNVKNKENWVRCCTLQGHTMDVLDLDWAPNGLLASGSVDNLIMIWNVGYALLNNKAIISPYRILSGHYSFVKGVSFDPIGQYLVSCGADNLVLVWNCEPIEGVKKGSKKSADDWSVVKELSAPMKNCSDKGMYRRIHWSADGQTVCVSSCVKSGKPVGMVLKRDTWETAADLVGHAATTASCRYCPYVLHILQTPPPPSQPAEAPVIVTSLAVAAVTATPETVIVAEVEEAKSTTASSEVVSVASTSQSINDSEAAKTDKVLKEKSSAEKPERKKRRLSRDTNNEEKRYSTSSADRSQRFAIKEQQRELALMALEDKPDAVEEMQEDAPSAVDQTSFPDESGAEQGTAEEVSDPKRTSPANLPPEPERASESPAVPSLDSEATALVEAPSTPPRTSPSCTLSASPPKVPATTPVASAVSPSEASVDQSTLALTLTSELTTLLALGDQSGVLSLWAAHDTRPLAVIRGLFDGAITDIAWMRYGSSTSSSSGSSEAQYSRLLLACCSIDGHLALLDLPGERFTPFDSKEMEAHCRSLYCETVESNTATDSVAGKILRNDVYGVQMNAFMPSSSSVEGSILVGLSGIELIKHQKETMTVAKNGKKRIKPVQVEEQAPDPSTTARSNQSAASIAAAALQDAEAREKEEWCWNGGALHKEAVHGPSQPPSRGSNVSHYHSSSYREPVHLQPSSSSSSSHRNQAGSGLSRSPESSNDARKRIRFSEQHQYHLYTPPDSLSSYSRDSVGGVRSTSSSGSAVINDLTSMVRRKSGSSYPPPPAAASPVTVNRSITIQYSDRKTVCTVPIRGADESVECLVTSADEADVGLLLTARPVKNESKSTFEMSTSKSKEVLWTAQLPVQNITVLKALSFGSTLADITGFIVAGCADGSVHWVDVTLNRQLLSPLILGSAIVFCDIAKAGATLLSEKSVRLMVATALGEVFVWMASICGSKLKSVVRTSLRSVMFSVHCQLRIGTLTENTNRRNSEPTEDAVVVEKCFLNSDGEVVINIKNRESDVCSAFIFREDAQVWSRES